MAWNWVKISGGIFMAVLMARRTPARARGETASAEARIK